MANTPTDLLADFHQQLASAQRTAARAVGPVVVAALRGMGFCIVPEAYVKILEKLVAKTAEHGKKEGSGG